jgi:hypothetical protein
MNELYRQLLDAARVRDQARLGALRAEWDGYSRAGW